MKSLRVKSVAWESGDTAILGTDEDGYYLVKVSQMRRNTLVIEYLHDNTRISISRNDPELIGRSTKSGYTKRMTRRQVKQILEPQQEIPKLRTSSPNRNDTRRQIKQAPKPQQEVPKSAPSRNDVDEKDMVVIIKSPRQDRAFLANQSDLDYIYENWIRSYSGFTRPQLTIVKTKDAAKERWTKALGGYSLDKPRPIQDAEVIVNDGYMQFFTGIRSASRDIRDHDEDPRDSINWIPITRTHRETDDNDKNMVVVVPLSRKGKAYPWGAFSASQYDLKMVEKWRRQYNDGSFTIYKLKDEFKKKWVNLLKKHSVDKPKRMKDTDEIFKDSYMRFEYQFDGLIYREAPRMRDAPGQTPLDITQWTTVNSGR